MAEGYGLRDPYPSLERQREAGRLGMLLFLANEIMLFGGLLAGALALRLLHPHEYVEASREMHIWLGGINTALMLTSSMLVAVAVIAVWAGRAGLAKWLLGGAIVLGVAFLTVKGIEYRKEFMDGVMPHVSDFALHGGPRELFMNVYFAATGLHAVHVIVGLLLLGALIWPFGAARRDEGAAMVGNVALYWHLVDIVWVFLYPTLYLAR